MKIFAQLLLVLLLSSPLCSFAESGATPMAPTNSIGPSLGGIIFTGFGVAAGINPATLPGFKKASVVHLGYTPALNNGEAHQGLLSLATSKGKFGFGMGLTTAQGSGAGVYGGFAGIGRSFENVSLGLAVRDQSFSVRSDPEVDIGLTLGSERGLKGGLVLYHLNNAARASVGVGFDGGKKYNLEGTVLLPAFNNLGNNGYVLSVSANIFIDWFGVYFRTSYFTSGNDYQHAIALNTWLGENFSLLVQYDTPQTWTLGLTLKF